MRRKTDNGLKKIWEKYIDKNVYRVISEEYLRDVKNKGFNPKKDPFSISKKNQIKKFFRIVLRLEKKGIVYKEKIGKKNNIRVRGGYIVERANVSMDSNFIDFTANYLQALKFKRKWRGGALTEAVYNFCNFLKNKERYLTKKEKKRLKDMFIWVLKKRDYKNRIVFLKGSSKYLENAKFRYQARIRKNQKYWHSPYGSFEHFLRIMVKEGYKKYLPYFQKDKNFYLRVDYKIPFSEIIKIL